MNNRDEMMGLVQEFVEGILREADLNLSCACVMNENTLTVELDGEDTGLALRENARLLYALNHLVNQVFFRKAGGRISFVVDCDDYRGTRVMELQLLARKAAERVRYTTQPYRLQAMPAGERRIIHLALAEEPGVRTESEGSGLYRRVVISPTA
jgi:spoIIIJ-associated protein